MPQYGGRIPTSHWDRTYQTSKTGLPEGVACDVYRVNIRLKIQASLENPSTVFQADIPAIELCVREIGKSNYEIRRIYILSDHKVALLALNSFEIRSRLALKCLKVQKPELTTSC